ncbi:MAG: glycyl-radical enzyme activating protein [Candidatus Vecturithrix sp.]|jgi:pyruvate formate lyase activating enzyme|nr:glycyl-radical enzyme activating protein [Candidatus Vecturithrix sp.]
MIFNIQRFSTHDGAGIRAVLFFKGCPLRCSWCSNPESQSFDYDLMFEPRKCINCLECIQHSQFQEFINDDGQVRLQRERLKQPFAFNEVCPSKAITVIGEEKSVADILAEISKDLPFYSKSGGGVTLSGGEPFAQPEILSELLPQLKQSGIHVAVETCLHVPWKQIEKHLQYIDLFLADLKHTDPEKFQAATGGRLDLIISNFKQLETAQIPVVARIPVIPGFNHSETEMRAIIDFAASLTNIREVHLIPYHALGRQKYALLGRTYDLPAASVSEDEIQPYIEYAQHKRLLASIGG